MTTKELLDEYAGLSHHNQWCEVDGLPQGCEVCIDNNERMQEIIQELESSIRKEVIQDLLDKTKGIDDDGNVYNATQLDWLDLEQYALSKGITLK